MLLRLVKLLVCLCGALLLGSCHYPQQGDSWSTYGQGRVDSVDFRLRHHFWKGFNFMAVDSFVIMSRAPFEAQLAYATKSSRVISPRHLLMVEDIRPDTASTSGFFWIKIAAVSSKDFSSDTGRVMTGWVRESDLLAHAVPNTPISKFIHGFSNARLKFILLCIGLATAGYLFQAVRRKHIHMVHFNDIDSAYPTLLCLFVSGTAVLYQSMQVYVPDTWVEYYFHPVLNPFNPDLPPIISIFIFAVWALILIGLAVIDDMMRRPDFTDAFSYTLGLVCVCLALYLFFTVVIPLPWAYPLLLAYWIFAIVRYRQKKIVHYTCGKCGAMLSNLGKCPHCGAINKQ